MSKAARIPVNIKWLIAYEAQKNRAEPRGAVALRLEDEIERRGERPLSRETLEKMISKARNSDDPEDRPWSLSALDNHDIPSEALPAILKIWAKMLEIADKAEHGNPQDSESKKRIKDATKSLTIRMAKWIGRLYYIFKPKMDKDDNHAEVMLRNFALMLAGHEKAMKLVGTYPDNLQDMRWLWQYDAWLYYELTGDSKPLSSIAWDLDELAEENPKLYQEISRGQKQVVKTQKESQHERTHS